MPTERQLTKAEFDKKNEIVKGMMGNRRKLIKKYGKDAEKIIHGRAIKIAKKITETNMKNKIKEAVRKALIKEMDPEVGVERYETEQDLKVVSSLLNELENILKELKKLGYIRDAKSIFDEYMGSITEKRKKFPDLKGRGVKLGEDLDLGHEDDEPHMVKAELYKIGKYAMELYQMVDQFEGPNEVDFPAWWQSKITNASSMISSAKHYLEFELKEPEVDAAIDALTGEEYYEDEPMMEGEIGEDERLASRLYKIKNNVQPAFYQKVRRMINNGELEKAEEFIKRMEPVATKKDTEFSAMKSQLDSLSEIKAKVLEKLTAKTPMKTYIKDFAKSDAPQFKGKTKEKKRQMAVAAKLSKEK